MSRAGPDVATPRPIRRTTGSTEHPDDLAVEILDLLTAYERETLPYADEYPLILTKQPMDRLISIYDGLLFPMGFRRDAALGELRHLRSLFRRDLADMIEACIKELAARSDLAEMVGEVSIDELNSALASLETPQLYLMSRDISSEDAENAFNRLLQIAISPVRQGVGAESYIGMTRTAEEKLVAELTDLGCLKTVQSEMAEYGRAETREARTQLARQIVTKLWTDHGMGDAAKELVQTSRDFERVLDIVVTRGHFVHQLETFFLGCLVLKHMMCLLPEAEDRPAPLRVVPADVYLTWLLTSSLHDVGYPIQLGRQIGQEICSMYEKLALDYCADLLRSVNMRFCVQQLENLPLDKEGGERRSLNIPSYIEGLISRGANVDADYLQETVATRWNEQDHGLVGVAILWQKLLETNAVDVHRPLYEQDHLNAASGAIALHNLEPGQLRFAVEMERLPFAFLLMVMDELQEWHRTKEDDAGLARFELVDIHAKSTADYRITVELDFECTDHCEAGTGWLLRQIAAKRHKLANLVPFEIPVDRKELEIHAHFKGITDEPESLTIPVLHRSD